MTAIVGKWKCYSIKSETTSVISIESLFKSGFNCGILVDNFNYNLLNIIDPPFAGGNKMPS